MDEAIAQFEAALALAPDIAVNPEFTDAWNALCWRGAIWNHAALVLDACETAVKLAPDDGSIRDSRGLARALAGDVPGAIEDFEFAVKWAQEIGYREEFIASRTAWLAALQVGQAPVAVFGAATLAGLRGL